MNWKAVKNYWALRFPMGDLEGRLVGVFYDFPYRKPRAQALTTALFDTREEARKFVRERFDKDCTNGIPRPVKVNVKFSTDEDKQ